LSYSDEERREGLELNQKYLEHLWSETVAGRRVPGPKSHRLLIGLDEDLHRFLKVEAEKRKTSMAKLVRSAIDFARNQGEANPFARGSDAGSSDSVGV
jgi:predicted HicB family RNase H-like nuclease